MLPLFSFVGLNVIVFHSWLKL
jgi:hypothetical protein